MDNRAAIAVASLAILCAPNAARQADAQVLRTLSSAPTPAAANSICGQAIPPPLSVPPAGSGPVVYFISPCFERQGGRPRFSAGTYLQDIHLKPSRPSTGEWIPYDAAAEQMILQDFERLSTDPARPLADLTIEIRDYTFSNGVIGKLVIYDMIDRR